MSFFLSFAKSESFRCAHAGRQRFHNKQMLLLNIQNVYICDFEIVAVKSS